MMRSFDESQQRYIAIGILAAIVAVLLAVTAFPVWIANASRQATLDQAQERLERYQQVAARDKALLPEYETLRRKQKSAGNLLRSDTVAVAGAELQRRIKTITSANDAQIISTQILPASDEQGFVRVAIKVRLRGMLPSILQSFYDIETGDVFMFLDNVGLRVNGTGLRQRHGQVRPMDVEFDLIAYMPETS